MAKFSMSGADDLISQMRKIGEDSGPAARKVLQAGAEKVVLGWKAAIGEFGHVETGDMRDSVQADKIKKEGGYLSVDIFPHGEDRHGVRNALKAFVLHYGTSKIKGDHFVDEAKAYGEDMAIPAMKKTWDEYVQSKTKG